VELHKYICCDNLQRLKSTVPVINRIRTRENPDILRLFVIPNPYPVGRRFSDTRKKESFED